MSSSSSNGSSPDVDIIPVAEVPPVFHPVPIHLLRQFEIILARVIRLTLAGAGAPFIFHGSEPHRTSRELNEGHPFYVYRPSSFEPFSNWAPSLPILFKNLNLIEEYELEVELPPTTVRALPFLATALRFWMFEGATNTERVIHGIWPGARARMHTLIAKFSKEDPQPGFEIINGAMDPIRMYIDGAQVAPYRCSLFTRRDLRRGSEYLVEVVELENDFSWLESELQLWRDEQRGE
ncbi:hypothetical protein CYLTODRAFT_476450 [Cylindrobasidium torrendii FP15055 ss-10]|uniref:Uncharacterized protein n=1 Tax=Cylindrobasidium torrendii FP15055 ss-10 TaxID=1314674 RepID=A0A0D7AUQ5_9AGAR|nr:hypothetical protein CYLTODRAFT_476450 [Cylindrobasidium torrendii FP15055 ss-10]